MYSDKENRNPREVVKPSGVNGLGKGMPTIASDLVFNNMSGDEEDEDAGEEKKV